MVVTERRGPGAGLVLRLPWRPRQEETGESSGLCIWGAEGRAEHRESGPRDRRRPREPISWESGRVVSSVLPGERADGLENSRMAEGPKIKQGAVQRFG